MVLRTRNVARHAVDWLGLSQEAFWCARIDQQDRCSIETLTYFHCLQWRLERGVCLEDSRRTRLDTGPDGKSRRLPGGHAAVQYAHTGMTQPAQEPPRARRKCAGVLVVSNDVDA